MSTSLGISIKISADVKHALSSARRSTASLSTQKLFKLVPLASRRATDDAEQDAALVSEVDKGDDETKDLDNDGGDAVDNVFDDQRFAVDKYPDDLIDPVFVSAPRSLGESEEELDDTFPDDDDDDDNLSESPTNNLPAVVVNLERLCGYVPSTEAERDSVLQEVKTALTDDDGFDERVTELFELKLARHGVLQETISNDKEVAVGYPELICASDGRVLITGRLWKQLYRTHKIKVVQRILNHLRGCNRSLVWKNDMCTELWDLAKREDNARKERALDQWRGERRKLELDKLYQVRETFQHRLEMARIKMERLEDEREQKVQELGVGLQALDLKSNIFAIDENAKSSELLGMAQDDSDDERECDSEYDSNNVTSDSDDVISKMSCHSDDEADDERSVGSCHGAESMPSTQTRMVEGKKGPAASKKRRQRVNKTHRRTLQNAAELALEKKNIQEAMDEEERIREALTSEELRIAQAVVSSLEVRASQVDDLLESLQEDEWEDEEEGYVPSTQKTDAEVREELTLLDLILAMILGSLPPSDGIGLPEPSKDHVLFVSREHREILEGWKKHFGRLPASKSVSRRRHDDATHFESKQASRAQLREAIGIVDNDGEWDDPVGTENVSPARVQEEGAPSAMVSPNTVPSLRPGGGLRPGGSLAR